MNWTLTQAKAQLSEVVRRAMSRGPQTISVRGRAAAVMISISDYERLTDPTAPKTLLEALSRMDLDGVDLRRDPN
jgi:antitoxin Phd